MLGDLICCRKYPYRYPFMPKILKISIIYLCYEIYLSAVKSMAGDLKKDVVKISQE